MQYLKYTRELQDLGLRVTNIKSETAALEIENQKLKENQKKTEEYHNEKCKALEERCRIYEKNKSLGEEGYQEKVLRLRKLNMEELESIRKDSFRKNKELEDQTVRINMEKSSYETRIKQLTIELNNLKTDKEKELQMLEEQIKTSYLLQIEANNKALETKINQLEKSREQLIEKNKEILIQISEKEKSDDIELESLEKDIIKTKEEFIVAQKENAILKSRVQQAQNEQQMNTSTIERFDTSRKAFSEELKKIKSTANAQSVRLRTEQDKERQVFEQMRGQLYMRIKELEKENIRLRSEVLKAKQDANQLCYNLTRTVKDVVGERLNEHNQS